MSRGFCPSLAASASFVATLQVIASTPTQSQPRHLDSRPAAGGITEQGGMHSPPLQPLVTLVKVTAPCLGGLGPTLRRTLTEFETAQPKHFRSCHRFHALLATALECTGVTSKAASPQNRSTSNLRSRKPEPPSSQHPSPISPRLQKTQDKASTTAPHSSPPAPTGHSPQLYTARAHSRASWQDSQDTAGRTHIRIQWFNCTVSA